LIAEKNFTFYLMENNLSKIENKKQNQNLEFADKIFFVGKKILFGISQPLIEVFYGIKKDTILYWPVITWGILFDFLALSHLDQKVFKFLKVEWLYPTHLLSYSLYSFVGATFGFWVWGAIQTNKKNNMIQRLTDVFQEAGLKSPMGRLPNFIFDVPVDEFVRRLRVTNAFMPKAKFIEAKDRLESALQVYVDEVTESKASGTVDLLYSHYEISKMVELKDHMTKTPQQFLVGQTRAKTIYSSLTDTPHLLIGGQTGGGKSTFLRQLVASLYCNNQNYDFTLIDMKGGLEFQLFENRERISVISNAKTAKEKFTKLDEILTERFKLLKTNSCKDIEEFYKKPVEELKLPDGLKHVTANLNRHIVVIDEAAELFLTSGKNNIADIQDLTRKAIRIAAQGRAVGIHLIIATQKPDSNAISTQIKANLTGIISFPMATLGASMSILGNGRAKELPAIPGRAVWRSGLEQYEVQTPFISPDQVKVELDKISPLVVEGLNETKE
jgi:hypothetical protein